MTRFKSSDEMITTDRDQINDIANGGRHCNYFSVKHKHEINLAHRDGSKMRQQIWQEFIGERLKKNLIARTTSGVKI